MVPREHIAYVTKEVNFPFAQFTKDTQLGLIDEWKNEKVSSDLIKTILGGGDMTVSRKFKEPLTIMAKIPIYITTNELPDFGEDQQIVNDRLHIFRTKELPVHMRKGNAQEYVS